MASIDGGTLAAQKELKCQINSVRAPDTQEFLYLAPWEADKDRLCQRAGLDYRLGLFLFIFFTPTSASSSSSCPLARHRPMRRVSATQTRMRPRTPHRDSQTAKPQKDISVNAIFFSNGYFEFMPRFRENCKAGICFLARLSVLDELSYDTLVVNRRGREPHKGRRGGQSHLTTVYLLHSAFQQVQRGTFSALAILLNSDSAVFCSLMTVDDAPLGSISFKMLLGQ